MQNCADLCGNTLGCTYFTFLAEDKICNWEVLAEGSVCELEDGTNPEVLFKMRVPKQLYHDSEYRLLTKGNCETAGYTVITDPDECVTAVQTLGLHLTESNFDIADDDDYAGMLPSGCSASMPDVVFSPVLNPQNTEVGQWEEGRFFQVCSGGVVDAVYRPVVRNKVCDLNDYEHDVTAHSASECYTAMVNMKYTHFAYSSNKNRCYFGKTNCEPTGDSSGGYSYYDASSLHHDTYSLSNTTCTHYVTTAQECEAAAASLQLRDTTATTIPDSTNPVCFISYQASILLLGDADNNAVFVCKKHAASPSVVPADVGTGVGVVTVVAFYAALLWNCV